MTHCKSNKLALLELDIIYLHFFYKSDNKDMRNMVIIFNL